MFWVKFGALLLLLIWVAKAQELDWWMSLGELCDEYGYEYEDYQVTTQDGYILTIQRIRGLVGEDNDNREPLYITRPFGQDEALFFLIGPEMSPGFRLVRGGYDVWLVNPRGNNLSRRHITLDSGSVEYWDFDINDLALDHMAAIELILDQTGFGQTHVYGLSSGGMSFAYAVALYPDYFNPVIRSIQYVATTFTLANTRTLGFQIGAAVPGLLTTLANNGFNTVLNENFPQEQIQGGF